MEVEQDTGSLSLSSTRSLILSPPSPGLPQPKSINTTPGAISSVTLARAVNLPSGDVVKFVAETKSHRDLFTVCEEAGMYGAKFINADSLKSKYGYVFDCQASPGNYIIEAPGAVSFEATFIGQSAHAAVSPEKGINAIYLAGKAVSKLKLGRWAGTGMLNVGTIKGGEAINVVPDRVVITGETRNSDSEELNSQVEYIKSTLKSVTSEHGGDVQIKINAKYGGYKFTGNEKMIDIAKKAISDSGLEPMPIPYPGGSDANVFNSNGIPALNLGVGFKNAHSFEEMIAIKDLIKIAEIGLNIVLNHSSRNGEVKE